MLLRKGRAIREVSIYDSSIEEGTAPALEIPDANPDPEAKYLQRERVQILFAAMGQLRPRMRTAIELRELDELTNRETARRMGLSVNAVKSRLFHGRRKLREKVERYQKRFHGFPSSGQWAPGGGNARIRAARTARIRLAHLDSTTCNACELACHLHY